MLNEAQMKMLDYGFYPNRAWMSIYGSWDWKQMYVNRRQRREAKHSGRLSGKNTGLRTQVILLADGKKKIIRHQLS